MSTPVTMAQFSYQCESAKSFEEAADAVQSEAAAAGFRVIAVHDLAETLAAKGFKRGPYKIVEICNAGAAFEFLSKDPLVGLLLPCRISVWTADGKTILATVLPSQIAGFFPDKGLDAVARSVEEQVLAILKKAA